MKRLKGHLNANKIALPPAVRLKGKSGLTLERLQRLVDKELRPNGHGNVVLHVGANDIGTLTEGDWIDELTEKVAYIRARYPHYNLFWSDMTPRLNWRDEDPKKMEIKRKRSQRRARKVFFRDAHGVIRHPDLQLDLTLLNVDGVHFDFEGQVVFWNDFKNYFGW